MTNPTPRDSAQLPPLLDDLAKWEAQVRRYDVLGACNPLANTLQQAREALRAQAASVEPVAYRVDWPVEAGLGMPRFFGADDKERMDTWTAGRECAVHPLVYAGAPPAHIPADVEALIDCDIKPRPLNYSLRDYHVAMSEGPLNSTWKDKPHRLVYDLIAAVRYYATPQPHPVAASSPATAVDAGIGQQAEYWGGLAQQKADADVRRGVTMPVSYYASTVVGAALQASRQPVAQQAAAEGAGDELLAVCKAFISKHRISCAESIYQTDRIMEDATTFIEQVCDLVGYEPSEGDDE